MKDFIAKEEQVLLERHGLASFEALWALKLEAVDEPNNARGGWSSVYRLEREGVAFYLKRQSNYLSRSLTHPFGEPTFAREFRNIQRYQALGIPALQAVFFAERKVAGEHRAILMTRALDGWQDLHEWLHDWSALSAETRQGIVEACGQLARQVHDCGQVHGCFYPKHIFLQPQGDNFAAQLIDLEKTRSLLLGKRDRVKDLEPLVRRASAWSNEDIRGLLEAYLDSAQEQELEQWQEQLLRRRRNKESRG